ncbi:MAG: Coenzyme F420 hydrogenase/dehydrogenase, beta subunit C-terminal domain [Candidatus Bathyarchaeia archaeon]
MTFGVEDLKKTVLNQNLCTACGACASLCPYIDIVEGRAVVFESCGLKEGKCYAFCPRTSLDVAALNHKIFGVDIVDHVLGFYKIMLQGRAKNPEICNAAQYGGVVSALMAYALEIGEIDCAVLVESSDGVTPHPTMVRETAEVLKCARSKYLVCPTVSMVLEAAENENSSIGFVGTPCQVAALRKMQASELKPEVNKIKLVVGLFCTWALHPSANTFIKGKAGGEKILKLDVPPPPANIFAIQTEQRKVTIPLDELRRFIMPSCAVCFDMTNEFADISVGAVEGEENWNTIIARTNVGEGILQRAINDGVLETKPLGKDKLKHLLEAALTRKKRVLTEAPPEKSVYLLLREEYKSKILKMEVQDVSI